MHVGKGLGVAGAHKLTPDVGREARAVLCRGGFCVDVVVRHPSILADLVCLPDSSWIVARPVAGVL
eukprot:366112-Chlamydomonas_euryale.AAC.17